jgi:threonine synthase
MMPVGHDYITTLGEGQTPLLRLENLGESLGMGALFLKDEGRNPTWSYKDRFCSVAVSKARELEAKVITISTSGNHGAATAAYAAKAGLPCVVFTIPDVPDTIKTLMQVYGAYLIVVPTAQDRWALMRQCIDQFGWYPASGYMNPPVGSNPWGIEGYKTIAYEIVAQLGGRSPEWVIVPTAYGDGLYGTWKGFKELKAMGAIDRLPKMVAAERFGPLARTLELGSEQVSQVEASSSVAFSIANGISTYQALKALKESGGLAITASDEEIMEMQKTLAASEGIYGEASSVIALNIAAKLRTQGQAAADDTVVAVLTSSGLKDTVATAEILPPPPQIAPELAELRQALEQTYDFTAELG